MKVSDVQFLKAVTELLDSLEADIFYDSSFDTPADEVDGGATSGVQRALDAAASVRAMMKEVT
jgi:hypothetical protein